MQVSKSLRRGGQLGKPVALGPDQVTGTWDPGCIALIIADDPGDECAHLSNSEYPSTNSEGTTCRGREWWIHYSVELAVGTDSPQGNGVLVNII